MKIWYMRDNHTFRPLPLDVEAAIDTLRNEFDQGNTYGMLCSKEPALSDSVHAKDKDSWVAFEAEARKWLTRAVTLSTKDRNRSAYQFPTHLRKMWSGTEVQRWIDENIPKPVTREAVDLLDSYPLHHPKSFSDDASQLLAAASKSAAPGAIELAAQLAGVPPCPDCGFVKQHCRCTKPVTTDPAVCTWCVGTGKFADHKCRFCNGVGKGSVFKEPKPHAPREEFLLLAQRCGATLTGKPDGSESITVVFTIDAWRAFDAACRPYTEATGEPWDGHHFTKYPGGLWRCADESCGYELRVASEGKPGTEEGTTT